MSIIDVVVGLMWSRSFRAGSRLTLAPLTVAMLAVAVADCASTIALDRAVVAYDTTTADSVAKQLLLNIARARHNQPMHFTGISSVAATYKFSVNAGFGGALTGDRGGLIVPVFGASAEENPTISIAPIQDEEFTQRLLTPLQEQKLTLLLRQGYDVDSLLRLMGAEIRLENNAHSLGTGDGTVSYNRPSDREGEILAFIGRGIEEEPEYDVSPDPRTPPISENPPRTLEILEARRLPPGVDLSTSLQGYQYAVQPQSGYQWNRKAFSLLYQLFQMTVAAVPPSGPAITISK
jgi:hypothetical protein